MQKEREERGQNEDDDERTLELCQQQGQRACSLLRSQKVVPVALQPLPRLDARQSLSVGLNSFEQTTGGKTPKCRGSLQHELSLTVKAVRGRRDKQTKLRRI